jgi:hypothetical protein
VVNFEAAMKLFSACLDTRRKEWNILWFFSHATKNQRCEETRNDQKKKKACLVRVRRFQWLHYRVQCFPLLEKKHYLSECDSFVVKEALSQRR